MKNHILIFLVVLSTNIFAQMPDWAWIKNVRGSDRIYDICTDHQDNIYAIGTFNNYIISDQEDIINSKRTGIYNLFLVKYDANGNQKWVKTIRTNKDIKEGRVCMNNEDNPVISFIAIGDTIDYGDTIIYYSNKYLNSGVNEYYQYLHILECESTNGHTKKMKLFSGEQSNYNYISNINIDKYDNYFLTGYTIGINFGSLVTNNKLNILLDKNYNLIWNYPFISSKTISFDHSGNIYSTSECFGNCNYHDAHFPDTVYSSFINKIDQTNGLMTRIHSIKNTTSTSFNNIQFNRDNKQDIVLYNVYKQAFFDDSIQIDSTMFPNLHYNTSPTTILFELDELGSIEKKCLISGYNFYTSPFIKKSNNNYYTTVSGTNKNIQINNDSITNNDKKLRILELNNNLNYSDNRYLKIKSGDFYNTMFGISGGSSWFYLQRMIFDHAENMIIKYDFNDSITSDNGLKLAPIARGRWSSFIAKLGNNTTSINDLPNSNYTLKVYPNPATQQVIIEIPSGINIKYISITNLLGEEIKSYENNSQSTELVIDIHTLESGNYFVVLTDSQGKNYNARFLKMEE